MFIAYRITHSCQLNGLTRKKEQSLSVMGTDSGRCSGRESDVQSPVISVQYVAPVPFPLSPVPLALYTGFHK